jgi:hypothetical protein
VNCTIFADLVVEIVFECIFWVVRIPGILDPLDLFNDYVRAYTIMIVSHSPKVMR